MSIIVTQSSPTAVYPVTFWHGFMKRESLYVIEVRQHYQFLLSSMYKMVFFYLLVVYPMTMNEAKPD